MTLDRYSCPVCLCLWTKSPSGEWSFDGRFVSGNCCFGQRWVAHLEDDFAVDASENGNHLTVTEATPTCCNQPMQLSTSPYRWDTGELIKGKLLVCREYGTYREPTTSPGDSFQQAIHGGKR